MTSRTLLRLAAAVTFAGLAAGCSDTASNLLTTGSILGASEPPAAEQPPAITAEDRALQVAATSARAQKCGYAFDPASLRAAYLQSEALSVPPEASARLGQVYDTTLVKIAAAISPQDDYCSDAQTALIKADLNRHLAGDYAPRVMRASQQSNWLIPDQPEGPRKLNPEWILDPSRQPQTIPVE
ncbi:MAG: hypothetical protein ACFCUN_01995 [Hyphomicrobiaceae bacterium]